MHTNPDAFTIFCYSRSKLPFKWEQLYFLVLICGWDHPLLFFFFFVWGQYLMIKEDVKLNYVTHGIINLLPIKIWWAPPPLFDTIGSLIMMIKGMIIQCFKWNYEHETSLQGLSPAEWLLASLSTPVNYWAAFELRGDLIQADKWQISSHFSESHHSLHSHLID